MVDNQVISQRNDIQGLRAVAVIAVILFHVNSDYLPGGFIGVDVFFVVSGYLITSIIHRRLDQKQFSLGAFYLARVRRIVPAYLLLLAITTIAMVFLLIPQDFATFEKSLRSALWFWSNDYFANQNDYFAPQSYELPLLHTWSLAVEMQFYLALPLVLVFVPRRFLPWVLGTIAVAFFVYSVIELQGGDRQAVYFSLAARVPEFLIGSLLVFALSRPRLSGPNNGVAGVGALLVAGSFLLVSEKDPFPGFYALPACLGVAILIYTQGSVINRLLSTWWLVWIGALSYSLYLWHWPILAALRYVYQSYELPVSVVATAVTATLVVSYFSYRFVEQPFRTSFLSGISAKLVPMAFVLTAGVGIAKAGSWNTALVEPLPPERTRYAIRAEICHGKVLESCVRGDPEGSKTILLMGDSHAAQLNLFADVVGKELGIRFKVLTASGCVPIEGFDVERIRTKQHKPCLQQIDEIKKRLHGVDAVWIAGKWSKHTTSEQFQFALREALKQISQLGKPVLLFAQVPMLDGNFQRLRRFLALGLQPNTSSSAKDKTGNRMIRELASSISAVDFLDVSSLPLFTGAPFFEGELIYFDSHHLNEVGSKEYGEQALAELKLWIQWRR